MSILYRTHQEADRTKPAGNDYYWDKPALVWRRDSKGNSCFQSGLPTPPATKAMPGVVLGNNYVGYASQSFPQDKAPISETNTAPLHRSTGTLDNVGNYSLIPASNTTNGYGRPAIDQSNVNAIAPHLQIPESVNKSKGSLAEFAAEITCLFWFETAATLQHAEDFSLGDHVQRGLLPDAIPSIGFRKWVTTIISTTQVGKNVILLALMFIYRLKKFNPTVSGKRGSEFRLLTIALMLGNKCQFCHCVLPYHG